MPRTKAFSPEEWAVFQDDADRMLGSVEASLLDIESDPTQSEPVDRLCRDLHTLKGSAGFLGLVAVSSIAHAAEDMVEAVRRKGQALSSDQVDLLLTTLDAIRSVLADSQQGPQSRHVEMVAPVIARLGDGAQGNKPVPPDKLSVEEALRTSESVLGWLEGASEGTTEWDKLQTSVAKLRNGAQALGASAFQDAVDGFVSMLPGRRLPLLQLGWQLAHRRLQGTAEAGVVLFDEDPAPPARDDDTLVQAYLKALTWLGPHLPSAAAVQDADVLARSMGYENLASSLQALKDHPSAPESPLQAQLLKPPSRATQNPAAPSRSASSSKFLRLEVDKVANLMSLAGEIGLAVGSVFNLPVFQEIDDEDVRIAIDRVEGLIRELQDSSATLGLVPLASVFSRMKRLARDLMRQTGKDFVLSTQGEDTEIDKILVDALYDPLVHLLRNAAGHGLETSAARVAAGKDPRGTHPTLSASPRGQRCGYSGRRRPRDEPRLHSRSGGR